MSEGIGKIFRNRSGAVIAGIIAAVLAVILLVIYLHSYRSSVNSGSQPERVLVATKLIPKGTSGTLIAQKALYLVDDGSEGSAQAERDHRSVCAQRPRRGRATSSPASS